MPILQYTCGFIPEKNHTYVIYVGKDSGKVEISLDIVAPIQERSHIFVIYAIKVLYVMWI
jgi:hypothetical protein